MWSDGRGQLRGPALGAGVALALVLAGRDAHAQPSPSPATPDAPDAQAPTEPPVETPPVAPQEPGVAPAAEAPVAQPEPAPAPAAPADPNAPGAAPDAPAVAADAPVEPTPTQPEAAPDASSAEPAAAEPPAAAPDVETVTDDQAVEPDERQRSGAAAHHAAEHGGISFAGFRLNGRFDLASETTGFAVDGEGEVEHRLANYHHFLFLSRNDKGACCWVNLEIVDLSFYEIGVRLGESAQVRLGKVMVPFGSDPLFHHNYGGLSGIDQKLLPFIWAEHGAVFDANVLEGEGMSLDNELYAVSGIAGSRDEMVTLSGAADPAHLALGDRVRFGYDVLAAAGSFYWSRYDGDFNMFMWGLDVSAAYGFIPVPLLDRLSMRAGFLRADIQGSRASGLGNYYHFGNYVQLDYRLPWTFGLRYRTGMVAMGNHQGLFFDDRDAARSPDDTVAHSLTLWKRIRGLTLSAQLIIRIEQAGEVDNDLLRMTAALDF